MSLINVNLNSQYDKMTTPEFLTSLPADRQELINTLHEAIIANDPKVTFAIKPMMGKEMIMYEEGGYMKYALASVKSHMSLHCLPIYMNTAFHTKYTPLLPAAKFQKGCINFTGAAAMPVAIVAALIADCSPINIPSMLENRKKK
ncbi:DUF1801 domain-containing protein [Mucilaginibacter sp.]|uniref:DUF1801 domain-containing protein n=1 Tax=Mucilaginibacter sp. TaxID=1882438 RepID=UPI002846AF2C|nr:DUF1801 domain-containing protein [Mucilaginibacter sp.]MDR3696146.1 DUF1801 domain-containing protein [Mucilaginibacter sp.]